MRPSLTVLNHRSVGSEAKDGYIYVNDQQPSMDLKEVTGNNNAQFKLG